MESGGVGYMDLLTTNIPELGAPKIPLGDLQVSEKTVVEQKPSTCSYEALEGM